MKKHQRLIDETALPDAETRLRIFQKAAERLTAYGYCWIGLDHFALPGDPLSRSTVSGGLRRNFQGYTTDDAPVLLGLGASSIGCLPQGYVQNETALPAYQKSVAEGRLPAVRGITLSRDDKLRRDIVERLMCDLSVDLDAGGRDHGTVAAKFGGVLRNLDPLIDDGLVVIEGNRITVTPAGRPFVRLVAANFDAYLQTGEKRHSQAV
jgi:oxygen-independent coproporphyrinogen-3 oxidase